MGNEQTIKCGTINTWCGDAVEIVATRQDIIRAVQRGATNCVNYVKEMESIVYDNEPVKVCQPEKHFCSYCQSTSHDDMRGNCCCCGAPRGNDKYVRLWKNESTMNAEWFNQLSGWRI